jgi:hypothetical protein
MSDPKSDPNTDETPDPAAALVIAKAKRLMLITSGATFIALAIVLGIIGYRVSGSGGSAIAPPVSATVDLPNGARVISTSVADGRIAVTIELAGKMEVRLFDLKTLKRAGRLTFGTEP